MTLNLEMVNEKRIDGDGAVFHFCKTQLKNNIFKKKTLTWRSRKCLCLSDPAMALKITGDIKIWLLGEVWA